MVTARAVVRGAGGAYTADLEDIDFSIGYSGFASDVNEFSTCLLYPLKEMKVKNIIPANGMMINFQKIIDDIIQKKIGITAETNIKLLSDRPWAAMEGKKIRNYKKFMAVDFTLNNKTVRIMSCSTLDRFGIKNKFEFTYYRNINLLLKKLKLE